jgi:hypothetical protein
MNSTLFYSIISELTLLYLIMFSIILFLVYFYYMFSIVGLELCLCIESYSACSLDRWVSGKYCVSVVPRPYLSAITPYIPDCEVDRGSDSSVKSFVILLPNIGLVEYPYYTEDIALFLIFVGNITMHRYNLFRHDC